MGVKSVLDDLTGKKFEFLTVIERAENGTHKRTRWLCKCYCGNTAIVSGWDLKRKDSRHTKSCGCYHSFASSMKQGWTYNDISGKRFGKIEIIERDFSRLKKGTYYKCKCDCGNYFSASQGNLYSGNYISCGCYAAEKSKIRIKKLHEKIRNNKCKLCSKEFSTNHSNQLFCCIEHTYKFHRNLRKQSKIATRNNE